MSLAACSVSVRRVGLVGCVEERRRGSTWGVGLQVGEGQASRQRPGSRSDRSDRSASGGRAGKRLSRSWRYNHGLRPCRLALAVTLNSTADECSPPSPPMNSQLFRPTHSGRIARSAGPLSIVNRPSST